MVERQSGTPLTRVRFPSAARNFSPRVKLKRRLSSGVRTPPCAIASISICTHVKDPIVQVRVRWTIETLKHSACTLGWVARSWLFPGKATQTTQGRNPNGTIVISQCHIILEEDWENIWLSAPRTNAKIRNADFLTAGQTCKENLQKLTGTLISASAGPRR